MPAIVATMCWHALRRAATQRRVEELLELEASRLRRHREFLSDCSHAIRTPATIARGHVELLRAAVRDAQDRADADEVLHQLDRLDHLSRRLLTIEQLQDPSDLQRVPIDVGQLVDDVGRRWSHSSPRCWLVEGSLRAIVLGDQLRLEEALDALIENAVRFLAPPK